MSLRSQGSQELDFLRSCKHGHRHVLSGGGSRRAWWEALRPPAAISEQAQLVLVDDLGQARRRATLPEPQRRAQLAVLIEVDLDPQRAARKGAATHRLQPALGAADRDEWLAVTTASFPCLGHCPLLSHCLIP